MLTKIAFLGAGSSVFVRNVLGDTMLHDCFEELEYALYDIDAVRAEESRMMLEAMNYLDDFLNRLGSILDDDIY